MDEDELIHLQNDDYHRGIAAGEKWALSVVAGAPPESVLRVGDRQQRVTLDCVTVDYGRVSYAVETPDFGSQSTRDFEQGFFAGCEQVAIDTQAERYTKSGD